MGFLFIRTIENDPESETNRRVGRCPPFGSPDVPGDELVYRRLVNELAAGGIDAVTAHLLVASDRASSTYGRHVWFTDLPRFPPKASTERTVAAYVNHSRWLWECACGCAQVCSVAGRRGFCVGCFNGGDGWFEVVVPPNAGQIAELLSRRPNPESRNWNVGETVEQLQIENLQVGADPELDGLPFPGAADALVLARSFREERGLPVGSGPVELVEEVG